MKVSLRILMCLFLASSFAIMTGCQSSAPASSSPPMARRALISTGQGTTVVFIPTADGKGVERLASADAKKCEQCEKDAEHFFLTGELTPVCAACGATRTGLYSPPPTVGHQ